MMTKNQRKSSATIVLSVIIFINLFSLIGCTFNSPVFDYTNKKRSTIVIEKPPFRMTLNGEIDDDDYNNSLRIIKEIENIKYKPYHFNKTCELVTDRNIYIKHENINNKVSKIKNNRCIK